MGYLSLWCTGFSVQWSVGSRCTGLVVRGIGNLPGPGIEPVSPELADGFLSTVPSGKSQTRYIWLGHMKKSLYKSHKFASRYIWKSSYRRLTSQCKCVDSGNHVSSSLSLPINKPNGSSWAWVVSLMVHPSQSLVFLQRIFNIPLGPQIPWNN